MFVNNGIWTLARKIMSFIFRKGFYALGLGLEFGLGLGLGLRWQLGLEIGLIKVRIGGNTFKYRPFGQMSIRSNVHSGKWPFGQMFFGQTSVRANVLDPKKMYKPQWWIYNRLKPPYQMNQFEFLKLGHIFCLIWPRSRVNFFDTWVNIQK